MNHARLIIFVGLICFNFNSLAQSSYLQINVGYAPLSSVNFGGTIGIEKNLKWSSQFSVSLNYNGYDFKTQGAIIENPDTTYSIPFTLKSYYLSLMLNWYPIKIKSQPYSLLYVGIGPAYYQDRYNNIINNAGPGLRIYLGAQYLFFNRLSLGCNIDYVGYIITSRDTSPFTRFNYSGYNFNVVLGYRFKLKK